jgi:hypothetical protein
MSGVAPRPVITHLPAGEADHRHARASIDVMTLRVRRRPSDGRPGADLTEQRWVTAQPWAEKRRRRTSVGTPSCSSTTS